MTKPSNVEYRGIFDTVADRYDAMTSDRAARARIKWFLPRAKGRVLEVGAGTGRLARALASGGFEVIATNNSARMTALSNTRCLTCDAEELPFEDNSFDTVIGSEMIYYLDRPERFIAEARRVLRPGGRLLLSSANNKMRFVDRFRTLLRMIGVPSAYFDDRIGEFFDTERFRRLLGESGFRIVEITTILLGTFIMLHAEK